MNLSRLLFAAGPVAAAAGLGGLGARRAPEVYARLEKPPWAPPAEAFGPVWSVLYAAIGFVGWRIFPGIRRVRILHLTQLALNAAWPVAFFSTGNKAASLAIITALGAVSTAEIAHVRRDDPLAAAALAPYLAWIAFAAALNAAVSRPARP
ncbi:MAG TPA: TspO/MBR family protein [Mycobacteriales bacterium]